MELVNIKYSNTKITNNNFKIWDKDIEPIIGCVWGR